MPVTMSPHLPSATSLRCDSVWRGATLVTMQNGQYNLIENGVIAVTDGKIVWAGSASRCPNFSGEREDI